MSTLSPPEILTLLKRNLPIEDHRGEIIEAIGASHLRMRLPVAPEYLSHDLPPGSGQAVLSGPITMGFADTAMYACVHAFYGADILAVIVNFNVSFLSVAGNADVTAVATGDFVFCTIHKDNPVLKPAEPKQSTPVRPPKPLPIGPAAQAPGNIPATAIRPCRTPCPTSS